MRSRDWRRKLEEIEVTETEVDSEKKVDESVDDTDTEEGVDLGAWDGKGD